MKIKKIIKNKIYNISSFPLKNKIILESYPDYSDNTKFVFDELIKQGLNQKYKIYWIIQDSKKRYNDIKIKNVSFIKRDSLMFKYLNYISKVIIDCNNFITKKNCKQLRIHLTHGSLIKIPENYFKDIGEYDYFVVASDYFKKIFADKLGIDKNKIIVTGFPRDDYINKEAKVIFPEKQRKKTIIWMPTYRNHRSSNNSESKTNIYFKYGVPCILDSNQMNILNKKLAESETLLLIKLHPAEDTNKIERLDLSNILLLNDEIISQDHGNIYEYLLGFDALITDYSSIYYDYMPTCKKVGIAAPDINEYSKNVKLIFTDYNKNITGFYIYNFEDLLRFIDYVNSNNNKFQQELLDITNRYNKYTDGKSSKRVVEIVKNYLGGD